MDSKAPKSLEWCDLGIETIKSLGWRKLEVEILMLSPEEKERGESDPEPVWLWAINLSFSSIFDRIKEYLRKRALRKTLRARNERERNARKSF